MNQPNEPKDFKAFYRGLPARERQRFAETVGTTVGYIEIHLVYATRVPRKEMMDSLWMACQEFDAPFNRGDLLAFFFDHKASVAEVA